MRAHCTGSGEVEIEECDVAVIGGGPVGLGLAVELGQRGVRSIVSEQSLEPSPIPKGQNLTQRTMEHFRCWGIEAAVRASRTIVPTAGIGGVTCYGSLLSDYHYDWFKRAVVKQYYAADNERLPQYQTENALRARARELGHVKFLTECKAVSLRQDVESVEVEICRGARRSRVKAKYAVGCDGSHSVTRRSAGISETISDHERLMCLLVFRSESLHKLLNKHPGKSFFNVLHPELDGYWKFFGKVDAYAEWFFHAPVPAGTTADNFDISSFLHNAVGAEFKFELKHIGFWHLRVAMADSYRSGRVFVAGDSAHSHPPYGAYGINTGFEDARNLGWKLAAVLNGFSDESLLETYDEERRPVFASTAADFIEKYIEQDRAFLRSFDPKRNHQAFEAEWKRRGSGADDEIYAYAPNYAGSSIVYGPCGSQCSARGDHKFAARPGHHLAPAPLSGGGDVYDLLGNEFALLEFAASGRSTVQFMDAAKRAGLPLKHVALIDTALRERYGAALVLVRPDHFVAWADGGASCDPSGILANCAKANFLGSGRTSAIDP
ncbi:MAG: FAD-dependent monooxygenase [Albidovulum sp.]|nr:FAD-dependent monooxygenase [Albidovulum sp.]